MVVSKTKLNKKADENINDSSLGHKGHTSNYTGIPEFEFFHCSTPNNRKLHLNHFTPRNNISPFESPSVPKKLKIKRKSISKELSKMNKTITIAKVSLLISCKLLNKIYLNCSYRLLFVNYIIEETAQLQQP